MSLKQKLPEILIFVFLILFVGALLLAKEFELFLPGGAGGGKEGGKSAAEENPAAEEQAEKKETQGEEHRPPNPRQRRRARRVSRLAAELLAPSAAPPAGGGEGAGLSGGGETPPPPTVDPAEGGHRQAQALVEQLERRMASRERPVPREPLDLAALFARAARELARLPGDRLLRQEGAVRRGRARLGCLSRRELDPGERITLPGFIVPTPEGVFLVPSLWRIRQGLFPRREELVLVRLDPAVAEIPDLAYRPVVVAGAFFRAADPGINAGLDARSGKGEVLPLD